MNSGLLEVPELDLEILDYLSPSDLENASLVNSYFYNITKDDYLWKSKVEDIFGLDIAQLKPNKINYRQQYQYLSSNPQIKRRIVDGRLDAVACYYKQKPNNYTFSTVGANWAAKYGQLHIIKWFHKHGVDVNKTGASMAAEHGHLKVLIWLSQHGILPRQSALADVIDKGHLSVLSWMYHKKYIIDSKLADLAIFVDQPIVLEWMYRHDIEPTHDGIKLAIYDQKLNILKVIVRNQNLSEILSNRHLKRIPRAIYNTSNGECIIL